jgi:hypothetical protein
MSSCCAITGNVSSKDAGFTNFASKAATVCNLCVSNLTVTNTITLPGANIQLPICTTYPLTGDGTNVDCVNITPGFCGSILQNINGAWDVYRSPGITEITVGNTGKPPGANFPDVASALGQNLATNCRFLRITDDTTDGALNLPGSTLVYIDPGVTWTVTGPITLNGDFVLLGNQPFPSSRLVFGGQGAGAAIQGVGQLMIRDLHIQHAPQAAANEILVDPTIPTRLFDVVVELGDTQGGFLSDANATFASVILDHVTLIGGAGSTCSDAIVMTRPVSILSSNMLTIQGTYDPVATTINAPNSVATWQGIRINQVASDTLFVLGGTITDVQQIGGAGSASLNVVRQTTLIQLAIDNLILQGNCRISNFQIRTLDVTGVSSALPYHLSNGLVTTSFTNDDLKLTGGTQISNVTYGGVNSLSTSVARNSTLSSFIMTNATAGLTVNLTEAAPPTNPKRVQINNLQVGGDLIVNMRQIGGVFMNADSIVEIDNSVIGGLVDIAILVPFGNLPSSACYFTNSKVGGNFQFNRLVGDQFVFRPNALFASNLQVIGDLLIGGNIGGLSTGTAILNNLQIMGNGTVFMNYDMSYCCITNFTCVGNFTWAEVQSGELANGQVTGNFVFGQTGGFCANHKATNIVCSSVVTIGTNSGHISNLVCLGGPTGDLNITGQHNIISGITNAKAPVSVLTGGTITVTGNNNTISNVRARCSVVINGNGTIFSDAVIYGTIYFQGFVEPIGAQQFIVNGNNCIINDVILGFPVAVGAAPGDHFTDGGFGNSNDGAYTIRFGNPAGGTKNHQVNNFSVYPRTAQQAVSIANAPGAPGTISFFTENSNFENLRFWFFPGGRTSVPSGTALTASTNFTVTIGAANQIMRSGFSNWRICYGNEVGASSNAFPNNNIGTLSIFAADLLLTNIFSNQFIVNAIAGPAANQTFTNCHCLDAAGSSFANPSATATMIVTACRNFAGIAQYATIPGAQVVTNT